MPRPRRERNDRRGTADACLFLTVATPFFGFTRRRPRGRTSSRRARHRMAHDRSGQQDMLRSMPQETAMDLLQFVRGCTFDDFLLAPHLGVLPRRDPAIVDLAM